MARRLKAMGASGYENEFRLTLHENRLEQPLLRKKPTTYFVNSMSDLFHEDIPDAFLDPFLIFAPGRFFVTRGIFRFPGVMSSCTFCGSERRMAVFGYRMTGWRTLSAVS